MKAVIPAAEYFERIAKFQERIKAAKLDACLVQPTERNEDDYTMVRTLTNLFHDMDLQVIAEGVEAQDAVSVLKTHGVDRIQGFALARPMPEDLLLDFYKEINKCTLCSE